MATPACFSSWKEIMCEIMYGSAKCQEGEMTGM